MKRLVWFRRDLRLSDNETLATAIAGENSTLAYVYIHEDSTHSLDSRAGPDRRNFLAESVRDLKANLQSRGADLICFSGDAVTILPILCQHLGITDVYHSSLTSYQERQAEERIERELAKKRIRVHRFQTQTLLNPSDLNFDSYAQMSFSKRRSLIEESWPVRSPLSAPERLPPALSVASSLDIPLWNFLADIRFRVETRGFSAEGGETAALLRVKSYFEESEPIRTYKETRNGLLRLNDSSKFSPYLSLGCVSARTVFEEVRRFERERVKNSSTLWFLYELLWRDHFHFLANEQVELSELKPLACKSFERWRDAQSGNLFIDAAMTELFKTGWLSNRMRQVAASFLIHDLGVDWRLGARWFESLLIDYDPCSNWGNWAYIAGADSAGNAHVFDVDQQAQRYDPDSSYRNFWITQDR